MKGEWRLDFTTLIPDQGELQTKERGSRMEGPFYAQRLWLDCTKYKILGLCPNASTHSRVSRGTTHRIVGDRLHIPLIHQLPHRGLSPAWHKSKQPQTLPLKEGFRQVPAKVTWQVFQTTWRSRNYTSVVCKPQAMQINSNNELKRLKYLCKQPTNQYKIQTNR